MSTLSRLFREGSRNCVMTAKASNPPSCTADRRLNVLHFFFSIMFSFPSDYEIRSKSYVPRVLKCTTVGIVEYLLMAKFLYVWSKRCNHMCRCLIQAPRGRKKQKNDVFFEKMLKLFVKPLKCSLRPRLNESLLSLTNIC